MNWLDITLLAMTGCFVGMGIKEGLSRQIVGLAATLLGLLLAAWFYGVAGAVFIPYVSAKPVANFIGFLLIFAGVQIAGALIGGLINRMLKTVGLSWIDRLLGGAFGMVKALLVGVILVMVLTSFTIKPIPSAVENSRSAPYLIEFSHVLVYLTPNEMKEAFVATYDRVKQAWEEATRKKQGERAPKASASI